MKMRTDFSLFSGMENGVVSSLSFKHKLTQNKKTAATFVTVIFVTCILFGVASTWLGHSVILKIFLLASLGTLGYLHTQVLQGSMAILTAKEQSIYSVLLTLSITIVLCVFYFFSRRFSWLIILAGGCVFIIPYLLTELWRWYQAASVTTPALWYYGDSIVQSTSTVFLNSIPINVTIQTEAHGRVEHKVSFRAPVRMKLGLIFYHIVQEQNSSKKISVDFLNDDQEPYGWVFFEPALIGWDKVLDPENTLVQNGIKPNTTIIARRVTKQHLLNYQQKLLLK